MHVTNWWSDHRYRVIGLSNWIHWTEVMLMWKSKHGKQMKNCYFLHCKNIGSHAFLAIALSHTVSNVQRKNKLNSQQYVQVDYLCCNEYLDIAYLFRNALWNVWKRKTSSLLKQRFHVAIDQEKKENNATYRNLCFFEINDLECLLPGRLWIDFPEI